MYSYKAFHLNIASELEIPEFLPGNGVSDIIIRIGKVPNQLDKPSDKGLRYQIAPGEFLLHVDNIAKFYVEQGERITIEPFKEATCNDIRLFLLGSAFGALFHQRNLLPLHASAIYYEGHAILFSGVSGIGKSTLAAAFSNKGYPTVSDDISLIVPDSNIGAVLVSGYPQVKLWESSLTLLNHDSANLEKVREKLNKFKLNITSNFYDSESLKIKTIYIIATKQTKGIEINELKGFEKFKELKENVFRPRWVRGLNNQQSYFSLLSSVAESSKVKKINRQKNVGCLDELVELIIGDQ